MSLVFVWSALISTSLVKQHTSDDGRNSLFQETPLTRESPYLKPTSLEKSPFDCRCGNHTCLGPAEPAIAVTRYHRVNPVSRHSGNEPEDREELPCAAKAGNNFDSRVAAHEYSPTRNQHESLCVCWVQPLTSANLSPNLRLKSSEMKNSGPIMANNKLNRGVAEIADTIEEHEIIRDLRHAVHSLLRKVMTRYAVCQ
jgi:hypothetical protein